MPEKYYKPTRSKNWYVRLVPPKHIQSIGIRAEYRESTGHQDIRSARAVGVHLLAAKVSEWEHAAKLHEREREATLSEWKLVRASIERPPVPTALSPELIGQICAQRLYSVLHSDDQEREQAGGLSDEEFREIEELSRLTDATVRTVIARGAQMSNEWRWVVEDALDWCLTVGYEVDRKDALFVSLVRKYAEVELTAQRGISKRNQGDLVATPPRASGHLLSEVTEEFRKYKGPSVDLKGLNTVLNMWGDFIGHVGDVAFNSVRASHVYDFLHARMHAPAPTKSWSESRAKTFGKNNLREIFGFARTRGLMTEANPVEALETVPRHSREEERRREKPRYPFLDDHLSRIFASAWYDPGESALFKGKLKVDLGARYWIPLFSMVHGNRVHEASQFVVSDFRYDGKIFVVAFRTEVDDEQNPDVTEGEERSPEAIDVARLRTQKNDATRRVVPVHPLLIRLGFIEFIARRRREGGGQALVFPSSAPNAGGKSPKLGRAYEQAFLKFVRDRLKFGKGYGNHSFRHQLEDRMRDAQTHAAWPAGLTQQYAGRKRTRAVDKRVVEEEGSEGDYGSGYKPAALLSYIERMDFSKVALPVPYAEWVAQPIPARPCRSSGG